MKDGGYTYKRYFISEYGNRWLVTYNQKRDYCISDHATKNEAKDAAKRYHAADLRRDTDLAEVQKELNEFAASYNARR
jgi:hypothetical protein